MKYVFAFILLMGLGLGVNLIMLNFFRKKSNKPNDQRGEEVDALSMDIKEAVSDDVNELKAALSELTASIHEQFDQLKEREARMHELILLADEKIAELKNAQEFQLETLCKPVCPESSPTDRVCEMSASGLDSTEIAKRLGLGVGEVELRLGLLQRLR